MLYTSPRNFKFVTAPSSIKDEYKEFSIKREDFKVENNIVFTLDDILSEEECKYYIEETNKVGYNDMLQQYDKEYRGAES